MLTFLVAGCGPSLPEEAAPPLAAQKVPIKIANSLSTWALLFNGISTNARANSLVRTNGLETLFSSFQWTPDRLFILNQMSDPNAQEFMSYLVSCALPSDQPPLFWISSTGQHGTWPGGIGLCPQWRNGPPSLGCLQQVSSCILALNNAEDRRVELSQRGRKPDGTALGLEPQPFDVKYSPELPSDSSYIASFQACSPSQPPQLTNNCGWSQDYIGSCAPGYQVWVGAGGNVSGPDGNTGPVVGNSAGIHTMLRVCKGIVGCNSEESLPLLPYSSASCSASQYPAVSFTCPNSGYFNVMKAPCTPQQSLNPVTVDVASTGSNPPHYRISEAQAFNVREGAFYGNLFTDGVAAEVTVNPNGTQTIFPQGPIKGSVYPDMYACHDPHWLYGAAYASHRVCALPGQTPGENQNCAANIVGSCASPTCNTEDALPVTGDGDYGGCKGLPNILWKTPITVFLNTPCDLTPPGQPLLCKRVP